MKTYFTSESSSLEDFIVPFLALPKTSLIPSSLLSSAAAESSHSLDALARDTCQ
ncbi:hypothetical protein K9L63_03335 [Candidatus Gracilibacteria bacterium]|nr:hypothetical protein [Candidatus Gracilibacteria bacterium]